MSEGDYLHAKMLMAPKGKGRGREAEQDPTQESGAKQLLRVLARRDDAGARYWQKKLGGTP